MMLENNFINDSEKNNFLENINKYNISLTKKNSNGSEKNCSNYINNSNDNIFSYKSITFTW